MTDEPRTDEASTTESQAGTDTAVADKPSKLQQTVEFQDIGPCKKHIKVTVDRADIDKRLDENYSKLVVDANVSGFRPGKAPRKIIERRFKKDVADQVRGEILLQSLEQLAEEHDVAPLSAPDIDPSKIVVPDKGPLIYEFDVEVRPQFDLPNYKGLKLKRPIKKFTDEDVEREERRLLEPYGQLIPKEGNPATLDVGDTLIADLTTRFGDKVISEVKELKLRVEPRLIFKDGVAEKFGEQVKGAKAGESRIVDIQLSDGVADRAMKGQTIQATFDVKDIKSLRLPEMTHELMHEFGVHSQAQLRELIRVVLDRRLEYQQRQAARSQIMEHITAASSWELPQDLLMRQARKALGRKVMEMRSSGIAEEEITARSRMLQQDVLQSTALALKEHFVLQKLAETEKIEINEDDINDEIERIAAQYDEPPRRVRARLEKEDMMEALAAEIIERKALDLILQSAEYEDVALDKSEEKTTSTLEQQAVPGEMTDPTAAPPAAEEPAPNPPS
ncbi:MAG: trigger factor [Gemmataceae bacterium]|nr:trigger factor [Gemmataceae bacterium]